LKKFCLIIATLLLFNGGQTVKQEQDFSDVQSGVDLMLVVAHPGDEYLYLGGVLPYYVSEEGHTAVVVYLTSTDEQQREEARASLKKLGVTEEPVFGDFPDVYSDNVGEVTSVWDESTVREYIVEQIRKYKPAVVVSHDLDGEYGNAVHMLVARDVKKAVEDASVPYRYAASSQEYGTWQPLRLFLHFYGDASYVIDRESTLDAFSGRSIVEVEEDLYESFSDEYRYALDVGDEVYGSAAYGLAFSSDGSTETADGDFFSGISAVQLSNPNQTSVTVSSDLSLDAVSVPEPSEDTYFRSADDPEEVIVEDWDNEHWEYRTDTLSIIIDRIHTTNIYGEPICYNVAHVRMRGEDAFRAAVRGENGGTTSTEVASDMARRYQAVLAVTGDNLTRGEPELKGTIIRNGIIYNRSRAMDCFALMPDLSMKIYSPNEITPEELLDMGVTQVYSFGPTLIRDGVINIDGTRPKIGGLNPRTGIGMIDAGHFVVITVDGRQKDYSCGITLKNFMHLFYVLGCKQAYNLDGGCSTAMVFMGEYLNQQPSIVDSDLPGLRELPDMLLWGESDQVPSVDDPVVHSVYGD